MSRHQRAMAGKGESGVYVIALALLSLSLLGLIVFLAIRPTLIKAGASELKKEVDSICSQINANPLIQAEAVSFFQQSILDLKVPNLKITEAYLVVPTFLTEGAPLDTRVQTLNCGTGVECKYYGNIQDYGSPGDESYYANSPAYLPMNVHEDLPAAENFWDQYDNAGNTVLCEVAAEFSNSSDLFSIFSDRVAKEKRIQKKEVRARSVWHRPLQNFENMDKAQTIRQQIESTGLTIIVAPHMTTFSNLPRFRFQSGFEKFDPIGKAKIFSSSPDSTLRQVDAALTAERIEPLDQFVPENAGNPLHGFIRQVAPNATSCPDTRYFSDLDQMSTACMNPAILMRNIFLSTIVELASRTGSLRKNTAIYLAGTQSPVRKSFSNEDRPIFWSPPVQLVPEFSDLTSKFYQVPYVNYYNGARVLPTTDARNLLTMPSSYSTIENEVVVGRLPAVYSHLQTGDDLRNGWLFPFYYSETIDSAVKNKYLKIPDYSDITTEAKDIIEQEVISMRKLISNQLRYCYHLFGGYENDAIDMNADVQLTKFTPYENNSFFEKQSDYEVDVHVAAPVSAWDQGETQYSPWKPVTNGLNAAELVKTLGSIQSCPYERGGVIPVVESETLTEEEELKRANDIFSVTANYLDGDSGTRHFFCRKPGYRTSVGGAPNDLRPDLVAALSAISESTPTSATAFRAIDSPGLFPRSDSYTFSISDLPSLSNGTVSLDTKALVYDSSRYVSPRPEDQSIVLIVTHKALSAADAEDLETVIHSKFSISASGSNKRYPTRPIHIVYMPTHNYDMQPEVTERFRKILGLLKENDITPENDDWGVGTNSFLEISPYSISLIDSLYSTGAFSSTTTHDDQIFSHFWSKMLSEGDSNIVERARSLFYFYLLNVEHRL